MPNFTDERLARFVMLDRFETRLLVNDLIAARARIAELEGQVAELRNAVTGTEQRVMECLTGNPAALKGQSNEP